MKTSFKFSNGAKGRFLIIFLVLLCFFAWLNLAYANGRTGCPQTGLVPCGTPGCPCTFCDFFVMFDRIVDFILFRIVPPLAALMIAIGGFMYIFAYVGVAEGGPEMLSRAKSLFKSVALGLLIVYGAWLIINLFFWAIGVAEWTGLREGWWKIECEVSAPPPSTTTPTTTPPTTTPPTTTPPTVTPPESKPVAEIGDPSARIEKGDELTIDVTIKNTSSEKKKFEVRLCTTEGKVIDKEAEKISPGETKSIGVSTNWHFFDAEDFPNGKYVIEVWEGGKRIHYSEPKDVPKK